ncbi:TrmH family RNA methyltransferase [Sulfurisoma sediminicola]|uniref:TrmH family RNA methyltransferase n=1 Tax=Sulfurisoma sediminicola TaxID=1381557 RepID=A0A497XDR0_9PROT|nr:RNA methyltransferase [Sulfurisoma sediminicola]RLJ65111.1 TrmH family RNA methyltransferase [Sulfurisoma sediminicola]
MKIIASRDNSTFKTLRAQRDTAHALLDGPHLLAAYLDKVGRPLRVIVSESGLGHGEVSALLARCGGSEALCLRDALFRELAATETPVGILAEIAVSTTDAAPPRGSCVLLDAVQDAGNVGTILRTAAAAGVRDVVLGTGCAGAWTSKVLRAGQGAHFDLAIRERVDLAAFLSGYSGTSVATVARDGESIYAIDLSGPVAWIFGNEGAGVSENSAASARRRATIPLAEGCESLNVAAAAAICLFEERRQKLVRMAET